MHLCNLCLFLLHVKNGILISLLSSGSDSANFWGERADCLYFIESNFSY